MAFFDFFKPKWKSKNADVRLAAAQALGSAETGALKTLAADDDLRVRLAAVERIGDRKTLEELAAGNPPAQVLLVVRAKIESLLFESLLTGADSAGAEAALARIEDPAHLERLAAEAPTPGLRVKAVERISDSHALGRILETNCGKEPARVALAKIDDEALLARLARSGASKVTRRLAEEKLAARVAEREEPARAAEVDRELGRLVEEAQAAASASDLALAAGRLASLRQAWDRVDPDRRQDRWSVFLTVVQRFEERREEERRQQEVERERREEERRQQEEERHRALEESRRARVEASAHRAVEEPALQPAEEGAAEAAMPAEPHPAVPAQDAERAEAEVPSRREQLCAEFEGLAEAGDHAAAGRRAREVKRAWRELPGRPERALEERFQAAEARFLARQEAFTQQQDWLRWNNKTLQEGLSAEAEALDAEEDLATLAEKVKDLQRRWKAVGPVPKADAQALWDRFKTACDRSFERSRPYLEELERRRAETLERKEALCREAEALADSTDWKEAAEALKRAQVEWKEAGPLPRRREEELYVRFRRACNRFFERRQAQFAALDEQRSHSQAEKERLCERAEALAVEPDRKHMRELRDIQTKWKKAGPAPREVEQALWERFRAACDRYFDGLDGERLENLRQKEALCEELEALSAAAPQEDGGSERAAAVAEIRKRWEEIGPVPFDLAEKLWDRFRALCEASSPGSAEQAADLQASSAGDVGNK